MDTCWLIWDVAVSVLCLQAWVAYVISARSFGARPPNPYYAVFLVSTATAFGVGVGNFVIDDVYLVRRRSAYRPIMVFEHYFWWELLVKRMDVLCCYNVTALSEQYFWWELLVKRMDVLCRYIATLENLEYFQFVLLAGRLRRRAAALHVYFWPLRLCRKNWPHAFHGLPYSYGYRCHT